MGCQCSKASEPGSLNIEAAAPKTEAEAGHDKIMPVQSGNPNNQNLPTQKMESADVSKISNSKLEESKTGKKKKKAKKAGGDFNNEMLNCINQVRGNPEAYAKKIEEAISKIRMEDGKLIFDADGSKISLVKGEEAFKAAASKLRALSPVEGLEFRENLVIQVPEDPKDWKKQEQITSALAKRRIENGTNYSEYLFNMDLGVSDPNTSLLLQIIDDSPFKGKRCDNIMNKDMRYIGISHQKPSKSKFCTYITFAQ
jgi:hypothetical protein